MTDSRGTSPSAFDPRLYAAVHRGAVGDLQHYLGVAGDGPRVLELGCGYGRVLRALARARYEVVGIDHDAAMLDLCRQELGEETPDTRERSRLVEADIAALGRTLAGEQFDRIFVPHNGLYCLLTQERLEATLAGAREHLKPDGLFAFDVYTADFFHADADPDDDDWEHLMDVEVGGIRYAVHEQADWQRAEQRLDARYRYDPVGGGPAILGMIAQRYLLTPQLEAALASAGFEVLRWEGDFNGATFDEGSAHHVVVARRR